MSTPRVGGRDVVDHGTDATPLICDPEGHTYRHGIEFTTPQLHRAIDHLMAYGALLVE